MRVLLAERLAEGHRLGYVRLLLDHLCAAGHRVSVLVGPAVPAAPEFAVYLGDLDATRVQVSGAHDEWLDAVRRAARDLGADRVLVPDGDHLLLRLARQRGWRSHARLVALVLRDPVRYATRSPAGRARALAKRLLLARVRRMPGVTVLRLTGQVPPRGGGWVRDPIDLLLPEQPLTALRRRHGLDDDVFWYGVFGRVDARKNLALTAAALLRQGPGTGLLVAGLCDPDVLADATPALARLRDAGALVRVEDRLLPHEELDSLVRAVDCVVVAHSNEGPSGLLGKALAAGSAVVAAGARSLRPDVGLSTAGRWAPLTEPAMAAALAEVRQLPRPHPVAVADGSQFATAFLQAMGAEGGASARRRRVVPRVVVVAPEAADARVPRRVNALAAAGTDVVLLSFDRGRRAPVDLAVTPVVLGRTRSADYGQRLRALVRAVPVVWRVRRSLRGARGILAINIDCAAVGLVARALAGGRPDLVLEVADVQPVMTRPGLVGGLLRRAERSVLGRTSTVVTTSPAYVRDYLSGQGWSGPHLLLENRVHPPIDVVPGRGATAPESGAPWRVGWFGDLRCRRSWEIIREVARRLDGQVVFHLAGRVTMPGHEDFAREVHEQAHVDYTGPYAYPDDLAGLYGSTHLSWCIDLTAEHGNSAWFLPNRLYEGGLFGVPALALDGTEVCRWTRAHGSGFVVAHDLVDNLTALLAALTPAVWEAVTKRVAELPMETWQGTDQYEAFVELLSGPARPQDAPLP